VSLEVSPNLVAALSLASRGLHIFPCNPDKTPKVAAWEQNATSNGLNIEVTWQSAPHLMPGLPVGAHGLVVIDADRKPGRADGVAAFDSLCVAHRIDLAGVLVVETPSGGRHFYFRSETAYSNSKGSLPDGIDVRGVGGYCIAPGATLADGRSYRIVAGSWDTLPALPDALASLLREKQPTMTPESRDASSGLVVTDRERAFAKAALADEVSKLTALREGRNHALNVAAHALGTMAAWIDLDTVSKSLWEASIANGYVAKDGGKAAWQTIISGINAGMSKPRQPLAATTPDIDISAMTANAVASAKRKQNKPTVALTSKRSVTLLQGSEIVERPIEWLWDGYLPSGKLTLLAGAGGTGKSTIAFNLTATITNAGLWPDGSRCNTAGNVLIWSSEDDPADTIKPRLMAVGANEARYGVISGTIDEQGLRCPFDAAQDMDELRIAISRIGGISLLIIDPIVTAVTGDMHKANDVRRSLQPIVDFAAEMNCAVIGITHFAKGTAGKNSSDRVIGSVAFRDFARMVLVAAKEEESDKRVFARSKSNNSEDTGGFSYTIEALLLHRGIVATRVVWGEALEGSSRSILSEIEGESAEAGTSKLAQAKAFLLEMLRNGPVASKELFERARETQGITSDTMRRAGKALSIDPRKLAMNGGWVWELPISIKPR